MDLRQAVETAKRILTKENNRQTVSRTDFLMNIKEGFSKRVTFDMTDGIEHKIDSHDG